MKEHLSFPSTTPSPLSSSHAFGSYENSNDTSSSSMTMDSAEDHHGEGIRRSSVSNLTPAPVVKCSSSSNTMKATLMTTSLDKGEGRSKIQTVTKDSSKVNKQQEQQAALQRSSRSMSRSQQSDTTQQSSA